ncbi:MAG: cob(I)yrinic acid a,c-diamide adenosyltransferase [bacterium]|nr:cob(I)yrinic acid a,c-diamide adenosyltransferase [bacterium]
MVRISKIYTKTGDDGSTSLVDGSRVSKDSLRVDAYGDIDELNSELGIIRTLADKQGIKDLSLKIERIQNDLFDIGSNLATPPGFDKYPVFRVTESTITEFETWIDEITSKVPALTSFVLPGGTEINAFLHKARTTCRRVERRIVHLSKSESVDALILSYFNRLSDLLFAMCREESTRSGIAEYLWKPKTKKT